MADFNIQLDVNEVDEFARAMPREIYNATRSAIRTTTTFAEKELEKRMSAATQIPLKVFKVFRVHSKASIETGRVWFGFKQLKPRYVGKLEQEASGASAGMYFFQGGFVATMRNGKESIFKRKGRSRLPIQEQFVNLPQAQQITEEVRELAQQELKTRFTNKLRGYIERRESAA